MHGTTMGLFTPLAAYENLYYQQLRSVWIIRGDSSCDFAFINFQRCIISLIRANLTKTR